MSSSTDVPDSVSGLGGRLFTLPPEPAAEPAEPDSAETAPTTIQPTIG